MGSVLLCGALFGAAVARADDPQRRDQSQQQQQQQQGGPRDRQDGRQQDGRQPEQRQAQDRTYEARAEEQRRAMQEASRNAEMNRRVGRMTPDERRDLRRQINEVGQDIYSNPPRR